MEPLDGGRIFKFRVQAESDCGTGNFSSDTDFLVTTKPGRMNPVSTQS
jgi:hypothetical protein